MRHDGHPGAAFLAGSGLEGAIRPRPPILLPQWLEENLILVDGPQAGKLWHRSGAPYLVEPALCLSDEHPCNLVTIRKSQQTGASILALGWAMYIADREPANTLYGCPGIDFLRDLNSQKLQPLIDAWQKHRRRTVFFPQTSRSNTGSTTYEKKFPGGYLSLANANAVMDLSSKTVKKGIKDELSKWQDIPGFGNPETLFFGRFTAFRREQSWKILEISTPEVDSGDETGQSEGHCRIDRSFQRSDQRFWHMACPECGESQRLVFERFRPNRESPHRSYYECAGCSHQITEAERVPMIDAGEWLITRPEPGRHPGFHIDAFISKMMSFEAIAEDAFKAEKTEKDRKDFNNVVLGLPHKFRGDAPDHRKLMERREDHLIRYRIPAEGLILTAMVDVQHYGLYYEVVAWTPDRRSYVVDAGLLPGDTTDIRLGAWAALETLYERAFFDPWDRPRRLDAIGVDAGDGGRANQVYAWCAAHANAYALKGEDGWHHPAISAQPKLMDIDLDGRVQKRGARLWKTGTWSLKREFYDNLRKSRLGEDGSLLNPPGYCHFGPWLDETYFKQITSEYLADIKVRGVVTGRKWDKRGENHYLDCRVGNMALAEHLGLTSMTEAEWRKLAQMRGVPEREITPDLFAPPPLKAQLGADADADAKSTEPPPATPLEGMFASLSKLNAGV